MGKILIPAGVKLRVVESIKQDTPDCAVLLTPGPVRLIPASGKIDRAKSDIADHASVYGLTVAKRAGNCPSTCIQIGVIGGYDLTAVPFDAPIYVDNDGDLSTVPGTIEIKIGRVIPAKANMPGTPYHKLLDVRVTR